MSDLLKHGLDEAVVKQVVALFDVLMKATDEDEAAERFARGVAKLSRLATKAHRALKEIDI